MFSGAYKGLMIYLRNAHRTTLIVHVYPCLMKCSSPFPHCCQVCLLDGRMGYTWNMAFRRYTSQWRSHRRTFHDYFHPNVVHKYHSTQITTTRAFLCHLLESPDNFIHHIQQSVCTIGKSVKYLCLFYQCIGFHHTQADLRNEHT